MYIMLVPLKLMNTVCVVLVYRPPPQDSRLKKITRNEACLVVLQSQTQIYDQNKELYHISSFYSDRPLQICNTTGLSQLFYLYISSDSNHSSMASNDLYIRCSTLIMWQLDFSIIFQPLREATSDLVIIKKCCIN